MSTNPFFEEWTGPFAAPPFSKIRPEHFEEAYERALAGHAAEIRRITENAEPPSFANTIVALEESGILLKRVEDVFWNLTAADTNDALQAIERAIAPRLARHWNEIYLDEALFRRVDDLVKRAASLDLAGEEARVLERYHLDFVRAGAQLADAEKSRLAAITERLADLGTRFGQNVLADEQEFVLPLSEEDVDGLPESAREAAAEIARERGAGAPYAATTSRSSVEPFLQSATRRDLREKLFLAFIHRGEKGNANDNSGIISETVALRAERARLLGYKSFAHFKLADSMARTPENARALLERVWTPARNRALEERDRLQALASSEGANFPIRAWDWRFYAEKLRKREFDFDDGELMPYFELGNMIEAAFDTAGRLFGLAFRERPDIETYHPDVRCWEVSRNGEAIGLFMGDYFARSSKRGGAWMSSFREQENLSTRVLPIIVNVCNFPKAEPALLSFEEVRTLFHEFGHALHGLLSNVKFPRLAGTHVATDFVELPSQIFEHWASEPEILERFAHHCETGKAMPRDLLERLLAARNFNQGFATVEFLASALVDLDYHALEAPEHVEPAAFERDSLALIGMPEEIAMRHRSSHFLHVFAGDGYSSGYYSYMWSEVLDADGFAAFKEKGNPFDRETARRLHDFIYAAGGTRDYAEAYRLFRGRDPEVDALLEGRGLKAPTPAA